MIFSASSRSVPLNRSMMIQSALRRDLPNVLGLRWLSSSLIYSLGDGTMSASRWIIVPLNLFDFLPVLRDVWSLRIISNKAWPTRLLTPEMKILLRSLTLGMEILGATVTLYLVSWPEASCWDTFIDDVPRPRAPRPEDRLSLFEDVY